MSDESTPSTVTSPELKIVPNHDDSRYELWDGGQYIGFLGYTVDEITAADSQRESVVRLQHTIVDEKYGRRGYARALVTMVLDRLKAEGDSISPECSYVEDYLQRYPEYQGMVHEL